METTDADGNTVDVEIEPTLSHPTHGAGFYSDVIEYDVTTIKTQLFGHTSPTWWEQTDYYNTGNTIVPDTSNPNTVLPYDATLTVRATDYMYDQEEWKLKIALESTYSTAQNRIGYDDFTLALRDICWDIPTVAPTMTGTEYSVYLWDDASDPISEDIELATNMELGATWSDQSYCGGFTYTIEVVTPDPDAPITTRVDPVTGLTPTNDELTAVLNSFYTNSFSNGDGTGVVTMAGFVTHGFISGEEASDWVNPTSGIGNWVIKIVGTVGNVDTGLTSRGDSGLFTTNVAETTQFTLQINNPCVSSQIDDIFLIPDDYGAGIPTLEARVNPGVAASPVQKYYEEPIIKKTTGIYANGYTNCGAKKHYIANYDASAPAGSEYHTLTEFHPYYDVRSSLTYYQQTTGLTTPRYYISLDPSEELDLGRYQYGFIIEMEDYPTL